MNPAPRVVLLANGDMPDIAYLKQKLRGDDHFIAANGGSKIAFGLNIVPHLLIGDSDSLPEEISRWLKTHNVPSEGHPPQKDETDLELALDHAIKLNPREILFLGISGSRTDHTLANFSLLAQVAARNIQAEVIVNREHIYTVTDEFVLSGTRGDTVSLLPWGGDAGGITTRGLTWELADDTLQFGSARGISNIMREATVHTRVTTGLLLLVHQRGEIR